MVSILNMPDGISSTLPPKASGIMSSSYSAYADPNPSSGLVFTLPVYPLNLSSARSLLDVSLAPLSETGIGFRVPVVVPDVWVMNASSRPDLSVYHELTVQLHKEGSTAARQMLYRFYMTLSPSQMLNARRTGFARSCQH